MTRAADGRSGLPRPASSARTSSPAGRRWAVTMPSALLAWALGTAVGGGLLMTWAVRRARGASVIVQLALLTGGTAAIVSVGAWLGARAMFYSTHDLSVLAVLLLAGGTAGAVAAILAGERLARATDQLVEVARDIGDGSSAPPARWAPPTRSSPGSGASSSSHRCGSMRRANASASWSSPAESWWPGCPTTCAPPSPASAP